jgi:hypothetical protein
MTELTMMLVTTPMKQATAKNARPNWVLIEIFITYNLPKIKEKVNKKILALFAFIW